MTRPFSNPYHSEQGFTILELLISIALMSLMLVVIQGGIGSGRLILKHANQSDAEVDLRTTQSLLRNLLSEARSVRAIDPNIGTHVVISGSHDQLTFYSAYTVEGQVGGIYRTTLLLSTQTAGGLNLVLQQHMHRPALDSITNSRVPETATVLVKSVKGLRIRYYGRPELGKPAAWLDSWAAARALPELVEISVDFAPDDRRVWNEIIIPLVLQE